MDFVVVYYAKEGDENVVIATWDTTHGFAHRDLCYLGPENNRRKMRLPPAPLQSQCEEAVSDAYRNWPRYYEEYLARRGE